jgi:hypothetical protein
MKEAIMEDEIEQFRRAVKAWRGNRKLGARPYTGGMKTKAVQLAEALAERRIPENRIPPMLGIAFETLKKWRDPRRESALIPVRIVPEAVNAMRAAPGIGRDGGT